MKKLSTPDIKNVELWDNIVSHKRVEVRKLLSSYRQTVMHRYTYFMNNLNSLENIVPLNKAIWGNAKDELEGLYSNNVYLNEAKKKILVVNKCPYCRINHPNTLDHYFDKSDYPEFSVFTPNLIPCCSECNGKKGVIVFDANNNRQFIHFYYDQLPDYQFLFVRFTLTPCEKIPTVNVYLNIPSTETLKSQIEFHFSRLELLSKYKDQIQEKISTIIGLIRKADKEGFTVSQMRNILCCQYDSMVEEYGYNYWEACMYEGVLSSEGFIETYFSNSIA